MSWCCSGFSIEPFCRDGTEVPRGVGSSYVVGVGWVWVLQAKLIDDLLSVGPPRILTSQLTRCASTMSASITRIGLYPLVPRFVPTQPSAGASLPRSTSTPLLTFGRTWSVGVRMDEALRHPGRVPAGRICSSCRSSRSSVGDNCLFYAGALMYTRSAIPDPDTLTPLNYRSPLWHQHTHQDREVV